ncbi:MAG: sensor histidine kinase [Bacteroidota bacterium]
MHRSKATYLIEFLMHFVFWLIAYYALKALAASSFTMLVNNNGSIATQDGRMLFPYAWLVLIFLMVLFYSGSFRLFKKAVGHPAIMLRVVLIGSWFLMLYGLNYLVVYFFTDSAAHNLPALKITTPFAPPSPPLKVSAFSIENWNSLQPIIALIFILVAGLAAAYFYIGESIKKELLRSRAEADRAGTELKFLRTQINPHFLFNTLNNLFSLAQGEGKDKVADKIAKLSGMMRYMIYDSSTESVPLEKEIDYLQDCIALHELRYPRNQVAISFSYPNEAAIAGIQLPPMLLIPFLENSFKHGVYARHNSYIAMEIRIEQKKFIFTCENTDYGDIKKHELEKGGIGLENVKRRLELLYPGRHKLILGPENGIFKVHLEIDLA